MVIFLGIIPLQLVILKTWNTISYSPLFFLTQQNRSKKDSLLSYSLSFVVVFFFGCLLIWSPKERLIQLRERFLSFFLLTKGVMNHAADAHRTDLMTITRHVLNEQSKYPESRGDFTILLNHIVFGCKFVCSSVSKVFTLFFVVII